MITTERDGPVLRCTIDRPDRRNALDAEHLAALAELRLARDGVDVVLAVHEEAPRAVRARELHETRPEPVRA